MKKIMRYIIFAATAAAAVGALGNAVCAQGGKGVKSVTGQTAVKRIDPRDFKNFDPKKLVDPQKINRQLQIPDVFVKDAALVWWAADSLPNGKKFLAVAPVLGKNSDKSQIYVLDGNGKLKNLTITVEGLDKTGKVLDSCQVTWSGWTTTGTEDSFGACFFNDPTTKNIYDRLRITVDPENLLNEINVKNNVLLTKIPDFDESLPKNASELP